MTKSRNINQPKTIWTPDRDALLKEFYPDVPTAEIAKALGCSTSAVYRRAFALSISKSEAFQLSDLSGRVRRGKQHPNMIRSQFRPDATPWNKGKHYAAGGRSPATRFKAGNRPANWVPLGSLRVTTYGVLERKVREGPNGGLNWEAVHRLVWAAANGPIPKGYVVAFRKGQFTNVEELLTVDRLECISRAENVRRNSMWSQDPEMMRLHQLKGAITRQVNRIKKQESTNV